MYEAMEICSRTLQFFFLFFSPRYMILLSNPPLVCAHDDATFRLSRYAGAVVHHRPSVRPELWDSSVRNTADINVAGRVGLCGR